MDHNTPAVVVYPFTKNTTTPPSLTQRANHGDGKLKPEPDQGGEGQPSQNLTKEEKGGQARS
jgi:hypothetical protein